MPAAPRLCLGVYLDETLQGALVFTSGPRYGYRLLSGAAPQKVSVLARLWLSDSLPPNSESRVIGIALRLVRKSTGWKLLLSYADPMVGHAGTIYQATGWIYLGQTEPNSYIDLDGSLLHPRTVYRSYGSNSISHLRASGINARRSVALGKYRYAYVLDPRWLWRLRQSAKPPPRKEPICQNNEITKRNTHDESQAD
jgi:hypothetical protein